MKYTKYIALFSVLFFAACTTELIEPSCNLNGSGVVQLASRVVPFSDRDVTTRANKNEAENKISSIDYLIFGAEDKCIFHQRVSSIDPLLVDKSDPIFEKVNLSNCYIVSIANGPVLNIDLGDTTWDIISRQSIEVSGVSINSGKLKENGLPMVGRYPEAGTFDFGGTSQGTVLTIPMKSLFSKIVFKISVDSEEIRPGENQPLPTFTLTECTVHNLANSVDFIGGIESDDGTKNADEEIIIGTNDNTPVKEGVYSVDAAGQTTDGGNALSFSFYLPERFLTAGTSPTEFQYPFGKGGAIREQDKDKRQQYKPLLAQGYKSYDINLSQNQNSDKKATFVRLKGEYSNHQGHLYVVSYDIYVGNDNYGNFDIVRNTQYNNTVIIKGINNSSSQSPDLGSVSIDHRVNVERSAPIIINLRRETLLDSHFEVRPMLIRKNGGYDGVIPNNAKVKVEVVYDETPAPGKNWIGLERSFGDGVIKAASKATYLVSDDLPNGRKNAVGKRKYFTTDLTTMTLNAAGTFDRNGFSTAGGKTIVLPITDEDQRVWIYIDECTTPGDAVRSAKIQVSYALDGSNFSEPIEYVLNQRLLYPVTYNNHSYNIEYHEEYLYNYDADDQYGETEYEGMKWGLNNKQLSHKYKAFFVEGSIADGIINAFVSRAGLYYDFYLTRDINKTSATKRDNAGHTFSSEIISYVPEEFTPISLADDPSNAIEYCYNRNKRDANGNVVEFKWYLPAIDEIENIMMGAYTDFIVFQDKFYWSSQPAFYRGYGIYQSAALTSNTGDYYYDDTSSARATKIKYIGNDQYENVSSGVDGYNQIMDMYVPLWEVLDPRDPKFVPVTSDSFFYESQRGNTFTLSEMTNKIGHPGNILRTTMARVRCVYKND